MLRHDIYCNLLTLQHGRRQDDLNVVELKNEESRCISIFTLGDLILSGCTNRCVAKVLVNELKINSLALQ